MQRGTPRKRGLAVAVNLTGLVLFLAVLAFTFWDRQPAGDPRPTEGVLDLRGWDPSTRGYVSLAGQWKMYWNRFVDGPEDYFILKELPASFSSGAAVYPPGFDPEEVTERGHASFGLTILGADRVSSPALLLPFVSSAYEVVVNGGSRFTGGTPSDDPEAIVGHKTGALVSLPEGLDRIELVLHVANSTNNFGGIRKVVHFGEFSALSRRQVLSSFQEGIIVGGLILISIYHMAFFIYYRKDRSSFFLAVFTALMALRPLVYDGVTLTTLYGLAWLPLEKIGMITLYLGGPVFLHYIQNLFPHPALRRVLPAYDVLAIAFTLGIWFLPFKFITDTMIVFQLAVVAGSLLSMYVAFRIRRERPLESAIFLVSIGVMLFLTVMDILQTMNIHRGPFLLTYGILLFILLQANLLSERFAESFLAVGELSEHRRRLLEKQKSIEAGLERTVLNRTRDLKGSRDAAEKANNAKTEFLATMSHELRTPLNGIIGFAELLEGAQDLEGARGYADLILDESQRMKTLIDQLLDLSKVSKGKLSVQLETINLGDFAEKLCAPYRVRAEAANLRFSLNVPEDASERWFSSDPQLLSQILINLVGNAIKYTRQGEISVDISCPGDHVAGLRCRVADSGVGIGADDLEKIFDGFYQAGGRSASGTGLGLAIAKEMSHLLGGDLTVESREGWGSVFTLEIPVERRDAPTVVSEDPDERVIRTSFPGTRVLVAEDTKSSRDVLIAHLQAFGCDVEAVANGEEAVERASQQVFDVILMDGMMPVMDGLTATAIIKQDPTNAGTPIVGITASACESHLEECREAGMSEILPKPFRRRGLAVVLDRLID